MKVLIIGQNSFVAKYFIRACKDSEIGFVTCSHSDIPKKFDDFTWIINFSINPKFFTDKYSETLDQDVLIARQVSKYQNLKYVMISSRMVYGFHNSLRPMSEGYKVKQKNNSIYGCNKILSEQYCKSFIHSDNLLIVRGSNIFGYEYGRKSFTGAALNRLVSKSEILLDISKKTVRDFVPANYFADCLMQLMFKKCTGVYNICSGVGSSLEELCNAIIKGYGAGSITTVDDVIIEDQFILDNQKLLGVVGCSLNKSNIMQYAVSIGKKLEAQQGRGSKGK